MICAKFGRNWSSCFEEDEDVKSLQTDGQTDRRTEDRQTTDNRRSGNLILVYHSNTYDLILMISNVTKDTLKNMKIFKEIL